MRHHLPLLLSVAALLGSSEAARAQPDEVPATGHAAVFFSYRPAPGRQAAFDAGYRRHLEWHRQHDDPLPWYAWYVVTGERLGLFIDATAGIPFDALDRRVDPAGDVANFAETVGANATPVSRMAYRLRPDLSTATPLESRSPSPMVDVLRVVVTSDAVDAFERALDTRRRTAGNRTPLTCYQLVTGGDGPGYLLMLPRSGWGDYESQEASPESLLAELAPHVREADIETWAYRADLSLLPEP